VNETGFNRLREAYGRKYGRGNIRISLFDAATNVTQVYNISATTAWQRGRVKLEQSDMRLVSNMAKMAKEGFFHTAIEETKYRIKTPQAEV
jgi:hypothetical protein